MIEFMKVTATSLGSRVRTLLAQLRGVGSEGDDNNAEPVDGAEVAQPMGLFARPVLSSTLEAIVMRDGDEVIVITMLDKGLPVSDAEVGETRLHGMKEPGAMVRIRASGDIEVTPKAGQNVIFAGGATPVAVEGSTTTGHSHLPGAYIAGPYAVTGSSQSATDSIATGQGAQHVKAPAHGT